MSDDKAITPYEQREILFYKDGNGDVRVEIQLFKESLWLTQGKLSELFGVQKAAVSKHLKNIFESGELDENSVVSILDTTAAEIVYGRADSSKPNMGLTSWKNSPDGQIRKPDVTIAKNYLSEDEAKSLNEIVIMYLDYAERQARRGNIMYMADWVKKLDAFLAFNDEDISQNKGKVTAAIAKEFAEREYDKYRSLQAESYHSDFDRLIAESKKDH